MIAEIVVGSMVVIIFILIIYLLFFSRPFRYKKKQTKDKTCIAITAKKNLSRITLVAEEITFERRRIRKGQNIEFVYPHSEKPVKLIVVGESGRAHHLEI